MAELFIELFSEEIPSKLQINAREKIKQAIELCAIYWHFLLIVWFVLFGLMIAT